MTEIQHQVERRAKWMRRIRWGLALAGIACWTILVATGGVCFWGLALMSAGSMLDQEAARESQIFGNAMMYVASASAVAPWIVGGIVLGVRWWRSRGSEGPDDTE